MKNLVCALAVLMVVGCASNHGTQTINDFTRFMDLKEGVTSKADIFNSFGQPHTVAYIEETGESIWSYYSAREKTNATTYIPYVGMVTGGSDINLTVAVFYFDPEDRYLRTDRTEKSRYKNMWLSLGDSMTRTGQVKAIEDEMSKVGLPFDRDLASKHTSVADVYAD